jgi:L-amino acid N-acyltransferase YncA
MAASTIMWLDEANQTAEFEPVGTHPAFRRLGLGSAMLRHGMHLARDAGATHMTVACLGAPGHPQARGLYYGVGFRPPGSCPVVVPGGLGPGGGLWLRMIFPPGLFTSLVPSGWTVSCQPIWWRTT